MIFFRFSRLMAPIGDTDVNLNQSWFLLFGTSNSPRDSGEWAWSIPTARSTVFNP